MKNKNDSWVEYFLTIKTESGFFCIPYFWSGEEAVVAVDENAEYKDKIFEEFRASKNKNRFSNNGRTPEGLLVHFKAKQIPVFYSLFEVFEFYASRVEEIKKALQENGGNCLSGFASPELKKELIAFSRSNKNDLFERKHLIIKSEESFFCLEYWENLYKERFRLVYCKEVYNILGESRQAFSDNFKFSKFDNSVKAEGTGFNSKMCLLESALCYMLERSEEFKRVADLENICWSFVCGSFQDIVNALNKFEVRKFSGMC